MNFKGRKYDYQPMNEYERRLANAPPEYIWESLKRTDLFEDWWAWIRDVRLEGDALAGEARKCRFGRGDFGLGCLLTST